MAFTQSDVDALKAAIRSMVDSGMPSEVQFADRRKVTYRSIDDLERALALMTNDVSASSASPPQRMRRVVHVRN